MLQWLKIKNLALVEDAEIEFTEGFNVISGETGAGKSVIINAINLLLGKRADKSLIRTGEQRCELSAGILISDKTLKDVNILLENNGLENADNEIVIRKVITTNSSRNFINDSTVSLTTLSELGTLLIDFHGPNQHQSLLKTSFQLVILDRYGDLNKKVSACSDIFKKIKKAEIELDKINKELPDSIETEHLKKVIREIDSVNQFIEDDVNLTEQFNIAVNSKDIIQLVYETRNIIQDSETSAINIMAEVNRTLHNLSSLDNKSAEDFIERSSKISEDINELSIDLENYANKIEIDEEEYYILEDKFNKINSIKRKYGPTTEQVYETLKNAQEKIDRLENFEEIKFQSEKKLQELKDEYDKLAFELSIDRKEISKEFAEKATQSLIKLGFLKADISVEFQKTIPSHNGIDKIEIMFCPNPGETAHPLRNIASSGEISRVMLGIKTVLSKADDIPILIFDEIDANIGGKVANQVGAELSNLGRKHHVLCISHLPQIASFADSHYKVEKSVIDGRTYSKIINLDNEMRTEEIARMLGGTKGASDHAKELLKNK